MSDTVQPDSVEARVAKQDFNDVAGCRVPAKNTLNILSDCLEHIVGHCERVLRNNPACKDEIATVAYATLQRQNTSDCRALITGQAERLSYRMGSQ